LNGKTEYLTVQERKNRILNGSGTDLEHKKEYTTVLEYK
jgi:hypothetical protein